MMNVRPRHLMLYGAAVATLLAAVFAPSPEEPVQPSHAVLHRQDDLIYRETIPAPARAGLMPIARVALTSEPGDLFLVDRPPQQAAAQTKLPVPVAPPLPYTYMGKMIENGGLTVFLTREDKPYVVHAGDVLDSQYRVDAIRPPLVELTYLPLKQKQLLNMGASK